MSYKTIVTPEAILCFPNLFEPTGFEGSERKTYNCVLVFPKGTDLTALKALAKDAFAEKFPSGTKGSTHNPFRDGNEKADDWGEHFRDATFIRVSSNSKPAVADRARRLLTDPESVYAGQIVKAAVHAYGYDTKGNKGVSFGLDAIQVIRDGDPLGGSGKAAINLFEVLDDDPFVEKTETATNQADDPFGEF
jgi:hypothetical protein